MPKKRTGKALLIKPGSQTTIASSSQRNAQHESRPSVNDLIRESRRLQLRDQSVSSNSPVTSVPPQVREALHLPAPATPQPRPGSVRRSRPTPTPTSDRGPSRIRTVPGPPPPRSWLINSRHAPAGASQNAFQCMRILDEPAVLPGAFFPPIGSLQDYTLKELAVNWEWHVEYDNAYLGEIPTKLREALLSYLATYNDDIRTNPLRALFLSADSSTDDGGEIKRLDLTRGIGTWTQLKILERDLRPNVQAVDSKAPTVVPDSWDEVVPNTVMPIIGSSLPASITFPNLAHLSVALNPQMTSQTPSWKSLLRLAENLPTLQSLSLAHWPAPTYTPIAASTRVTVSTGTIGSSPRVTYGGTNMYSAMDADWREAAGILRSLSRKLPALTWLDFSGCGVWWDALMWHQLVGDSDPENVEDGAHAGDEYDDAGVEHAAGAGPDWNGAWRGVKTIILRIGWSPVQPEGVDENPVEGEQNDIDFTSEGYRKRSAYAREMRLHGELKGTQRNVILGLREVRREGSGAWIEFQT